LHEFPGHNPREHFPKWKLTFPFFPKWQDTGQLEHFGNMEAPPSGGAKEVIYHDTVTTRYQKSMYHGIKVQAWDAYIWICLWMRKGCTCSSCSSHCRYQIKIPKTLFNSNRGHIAIQKWSHIFILTSFRQIGTVHWPRRLQPWLDCFWVN
jgi:hypothetical protein